METTQLVTIIVALLTGGLARDLFTWFVGLFKKKDRRTELDRAWSKADAEARNRRIAEEHASLLRRMLIEAQCVESNQIPPFPPYPKKES